MNLAVIAPAYYPDEQPWKLLRDSCAIHHLPLYPFGSGEPWRGDTHAHFTGALEAVRNLPSIYDLIMFTDAGDTFVMGGAEEIEAKYQQYGCDFLMSAEQDLYPWGLEELWASSADKRLEAAGLWQYPNGGGWVARRDAAERILIHAGSATGNEAQHKWISTYCSGDFHFKLDASCLIFQTMSGNTGSTAWENHRLVNTVTGSHPVVVHFNGKLGGIEGYYANAYGV